MPITDVALLSFFIFCFLVFTAALAWGDYATRDIAKESRARALAGTPVTWPETTAAIVEEKKPKALVHA
jgi:hypothetical protein